MRLTFGITTAALVSTVLSLVHRIPQDNGLSKRNVDNDDWAGVAISAPPEGQTFVAVIGTFVVPTIDPDEAETDSAVSIWVGIDGYNPMAAPLIQAGVNVEYAADGTMIYNAFTEWIDDGPVTLPSTTFSVSPGDTITVEVSGAAGQATATANFSKNGGTAVPVPITPSDPSNVIKGQNIEWIVERMVRDENDPGNANLLAFGTITFTACSGSTASTAAGSFPVNGDAIDMQDSEGGISATTVVDTSGNGDSFTVTWQGP